jgi:hypothetical protein
LAAAFAAPGFSPYLGRKAFAPSFPFVLGAGDDNLLSAAPGRAGYPLGIHVLDGRDNTYPDATTQVEQAVLLDRLSWWADKASIPERTDA